LKLQRYGSSKISGITLCSDGTIEQNLINAIFITI
jgi:hypothetical protein